MTKYAEGTDVSTEKSMLEIQQTLKRYGATSFMFGEDGAKVKVAFAMGGRHVRLEVLLPPESDFTKDAARRTRTPEHRKNAHAADHRQRYRALLLVIKAKLESVESGIETFEQAFMAHIMLADGQTMTEWVAPQIEQMYVTGKMPPLLISGGR